MQGTKILTSQNVVLTLESNVVIRRILAFLIDFAIICAYIYVLYEIINNYQLFEEDYDKFYFALFIVSLPINLYTLLSEFLMNGRTIGKWICGIRVVKINGLKCGFTEYLLRWLFRLIDIYPSIFLSLFFHEWGMVGNVLLGIPAFIFIVTSKNHQRLGDRAAGTTVIKVATKYNFNKTIFQEIATDYEPTYSQVIKLSDNDMRIIKDTFIQANKDRNYDTIHKLRLKVEEVMQIRSKESDEDFLNTIIKDFNHYTQRL